MGQHGHKKQQAQQRGPERSCLCIANPQDSQHVPWNEVDGCYTCAVGAAIHVSARRFAETASANRASPKFAASLHAIEVVKCNPPGT